MVDERSIVCVVDDDDDDKRKKRNAICSNGIELRANNLAASP